MMPAQMTPFGERLSKVLFEKSISDSELAKRLKIAQPNIHTLKYKTKSPRLKTVTAIAKALKVPRETLLPAPWLKDETGTTKVWLIVENETGFAKMRLA